MSASPSNASRQLALPFLETGAEAPRDSAFRAGRADNRRLLQRLRDLSEGRIRQLTLTRNRSTILSARPLGRSGGFPKRLHLRIHQCFVHADDEVLDAVVAFAAKRLPKARRRDALEQVRAYFDEHAKVFDRPPRRARRPRRTRGRHHDLQRLYDRVNHESFRDQLELKVTWGEEVRRQRRRRRTIQLGSYQDETRTIRIHPVLDHAKVPEYVVMSVLHHEMLHAVVPVETAGRRNRVHTDEFRRREAAYPHHHRAEQWLARHLFRLMAQLERQLQSAC